MPADPVVIVSAARTPMGAFQGELKGFSAPELGAAAIRAVTGRMPRYFRPPWGTFNWTAYARAGEIGETRVLWSVRPEGWLTAASADRMAAFVAARAHPGAIVDLHDRGGHASTPEATRAALPAMIAALRDRGLGVVPLRELLAQVEPPAAAPHRDV